MRQIQISTAALYTLVVGLALPLIAQAENPGPCKQITAACENAGFTQGHGLQRDCIAPIMQGTQPPKSATPLPVVAPNLVAACKAKNPNFGQGNRIMPTKPPGYGLLTP
jgi:hypothetical protein